MPKITFISPDDVPNQRIGGNIIYKLGDKFYTRSVKTYRKRKYYVALKSNYTFINAAANWAGVTGAALVNWLDYQPYVKKSRSPRNAFLANNIQIIHHYLPDIVPVMDITSPPQYPPLPVSIEAWFDSDNNQVIFTWYYEDIIDLYMALGVDETSYRYVMPSERYRIRGADYSESEYAIVSGDWFIAGTKAHVAVRACNIRGEVSPWSDAIEIEVPVKPAADFSGAPRKGKSPLEVDFTNLTTGTVFNYLWDLGDGAYSTDEDTFHTFTGIVEDTFTIRLTAFGVADSKNKKTRYRYIRITDEEEDPHLFITDTLNDRIHKRLPADLSFVLIAGTSGSGQEQYNYPFGIASHDFFVYICDYVNCRIIKRLKSDLSFILSYGTEGSGLGQFQYPAGITVRGTDLFLCDRYNHRIVKLNRHDLSWTFSAGSQGSGDLQFKFPTGIAADVDYVYICDNGNHRIIKRNISGLTYHSKIGSLGSGNDQFSDPYGITVDDDHLYIADTYNHRIVKRLKSDLSYVSQIGTQGSGDNQFEAPRGISVNGDHLYICDTENNRIQKRLKSDLSFVSKIGSLGNGINSFNNPYYLSVKDYFA
jgi:hypothetical protein